MNCPRCQKELSENYRAAWCPFCGNDLPAQDSDTPKSLLPPVKINWLVLIAVVFAPALLTMLVALSKSPNATTACVLGTSPVAAIIAGIMLSRLKAGSPGLRILLTIIYAIVISIFCLISCFFGCGLAGGGGVRIGG